MSWKDLLQENDQKTLIAPWIGGRVLRTSNRTWKIKNNLPNEYGWYVFDLQGRNAFILNKSDVSNEELLINSITGYLVGNKFIQDNIQVTPNIEDIICNFPTIHLLEPGLDKFVRVKAGYLYENSSLIFQNEEYPIGPESDVLNAFLDQKENVDDIPGVIPALDAAFKFETHIRKEVERIRREEEERRRQEEMRQQVRQRLGDGVLRREIAINDFETAARAALSVGGAVYLDHRRGINPNEMIVRYRFNNRRLECVCDARTLRIRDSGICLRQEYYSEEFEEGTQGDTWFTLESLPSVIAEAESQNRLVIYRHG